MPVFSKHLSQDFWPEEMSYLNCEALQQVNQIVAQELTPYLSHIPQKQWPEMTWLEENFWALLVLIPAGNAPESISCGGVVQLVYFAQQIHNLIPEEGGTECYRYPILVGDYLFAKAFQLLLRSHLEHWLPVIAQVAENANEARAAILQEEKSGTLTLEKKALLVEREYGELAALAVKMGAEAAKLSLPQHDAIAEAAYGLGVLHGMIKEKAIFQWAKRREVTLSLIAALPEPCRGGMEELCQKVLQQYGNIADH